MTRLRHAAAAVLICATAACSERAADTASDNARDVTAATPVTAIRFAPQLNIIFDSMIRTTNGVYVRDVRVGSGASADSGHTVTLDYRAWLPDGTLFEQRPDSAGFGAAELVLGAGEPPGLHEGIIGMRTGGTRRIVVPPDLSYGLVGRPDGVPPRSPVVFEVRLRTVR